MGHEISYLSGLPLFSGAKLQFPDRRPETRDPLTGIDEPRTTNEEQRTSFHSIRTPYTGWFPWDRVRGGWRLRLFDFKCFEYCAARWCKKHEGEFDVIQVCELPFFVNHYKKMAGSIPVVIRLTAPNYDDPVGGLQQADAVIASGMSVQEIRKKDRPDCFDIQIVWMPRDLRRKGRARIWGSLKIIWFFFMWPVFRRLRITLC